MEMHEAVGSCMDLGLVEGRLGASVVEVQGGGPIGSRARRSWGPRARGSGEGRLGEVTPIEHA
jgi:hypothetical protein